MTNSVGLGSWQPSGRSGLSTADSKGCRGMWPRGSDEAAIAGIYPAVPRRMGSVCVWESWGGGMFMI